MQAWLKHLVVLFPDQNLSATEHIAFSKYFGELDRNDPTVSLRDTTYPEIIPITNRENDGKPSNTRNVGRSWHTDLAHTICPAKASLLLCKQKPESGGDTLFANLYMAYEALSAPMRRFIDALEAVHDTMRTTGMHDRDAAVVAQIRRDNPPVVQSLVRVHPQTGRKSLLVGQRVSHILGMTPGESEAILSYLNEHASSPEFVYRHRWSVDDLLIWDNRCTMHLALGDYDPKQIRYMVRTSIIGDVTGRMLSSTQTTPMALAG